MQYSFNIRGHKNILSTHKRTIEFTKDSNLTTNGDCIVGVNADFELFRVQEFLLFKQIKITILVEGKQDIITAAPNKKFSSNHEMVLRMGEFDSERTFAVRSNKSANDLSRDIVRKLAAGLNGRITISGE